MFGKKTREMLLEQSDNLERLEAVVEQNSKDLKAVLRYLEQLFTPYDSKKVFMQEANPAITYANCKKRIKKQFEASMDRCQDKTRPPKVDEEYHDLAAKTMYIYTLLTDHYLGENRSASKAGKFREDIQKLIKKVPENLGSVVEDSPMRLSYLGWYIYSSGQDNVRQNYRTKKLKIILKIGMDLAIENGIPFAFH